MRTAYDIVIRPIITEQSMEDLDIKKYVFEVAKDATKMEIAKAVEEIFGVTRHQGHHAARERQDQAHRRESPGHAGSWKKAVVTLSEDSKNIEIFEDMA